jgi:uncharacterized surface anchored protein
MKLVEYQDFRNGTKVTNVQNNTQTVFNSGENFRILIPKSGFNSNINGNISITSKVKNYPVFYGEAPSGYQNYTVTYDSYGDEEQNINLNISTNTGSLKIIKIDDETSVPIEGVEFKLKKEDTGDEIIAVTNSNGEIVFQNLYQGKYILSESKTGEQYELSDEIKIINIEYNKQSVITIGNTIKRGQIKVVKKDIDTQKAIEGVHFEILESETREVLEELVTNENGEALSSELRVDKNYILREISNDETYIKNEKEYPFTVNNKEIVQIEVENEKIKGNLKILKTDLDDSNIKLSGVKFGLYDENMELLEELETDENGEAVSKEYPSVNRTYYIKELETIDGYNIDEEVYEIKLIDYETLEMNFENEKIKGNLKIIKVDSDDSNIKLSGVKFELYDENMKLLEKLETDENGEIISKEYPTFNRIYYLREVKTNKEYNLNTELIEVKLLDNDTLEIVLENEKIPEKEVFRIMEKTKVIETKVLPKTGY